MQNHFDDYFDEVPAGEEKDSQEVMQHLLDAARKMRDTQVFNNPIYVDILYSPQAIEYFVETYLLNKDRWN